MRDGLTEEIVAEIHKPAGERKLEPREELAVRWAETLATDHTAVDEAFKAELRAHFTDAEFVELGMMIGQYLAFGRLLVMLGGHKAACEIYTPQIPA